MNLRFVLAAVAVATLAGCASYTAGPTATDAQPSTDTRNPRRCITTSDQNLWVAVTSNVRGRLGT